MNENAALRNRLLNEDDAVKFIEDMTTAPASKIIWLLSVQFAWRVHDAAEELFPIRRRKL